MNLFNWFKKAMTPKTGVVIEVEDDPVASFNPSLELFKLLKERIADKQSRIVDLELENGRLRVKLATLEAKISNLPPVKVEIGKHFATTSALRAELERRSKEEKENNAKKNPS